MARVGLVIGAGGVVGHAFHAGVLAALAERTGWDARTAEVVVGTSAGSVVGALLRAGLPPVDLLARATGRPLSPEAMRLLAAAAPPSAPPRPARPTRLAMSAPGALLRAATRPWTIRPGALASALLPAGTVDTSTIADGLRPVIGTRWPAQPLWVCAVRLDDGQRVVFGRDTIAVDPAEAVSASCAIPGYFEPVELAGKRYVDGGAHSPTNLDLVAGEGLDLVVVVSPMSASGRIRAGADAGLRAWAQLALRREAAAVRRRGTEVLAFQPTAADLAVMGINAMDPGRRAPVAAQARTSALARLERDDVAGRVALLG